MNLPPSHPPPPPFHLSLPLFLSFQPSPQSKSQPGDLGTPLSDTSPSGQNTDTAQPPQEHSQEAEAARLLAASPESPEEVPLVQASEDGSGDKSRKEEDKSKKKEGKNEKKRRKQKKRFSLNTGKKNWEDLVWGVLFERQSNWNFCAGH